MPSRSAVGAVVVKAGIAARRGSLDAAVFFDSCDLFFLTLISSGDQNPLHGIIIDVDVGPAVTDHLHDVLSRRLVGDQVR